jgi:hypothetical protein
MCGFLLASILEHQFQKFLRAYMRDIMKCGLSSLKSQPKQTSHTHILKLVFSHEQRKKNSFQFLVSKYRVFELECVAEECRPAEVGGENAADGARPHEHVHDHDLQLDCLLLKV